MCGQRLAKVGSGDSSPYPLFDYCHWRVRLGLAKIWFPSKVWVPPSTAHASSYKAVRSRPRGSYFLPPCFLL